MWVRKCWAESVGKPKEGEMRSAVIVLAVVLAAVCSQVRAAEAKDKILTVELGDAVTFGSFTAQDATVDVETEYANPQGAVELKIGGPFSVGASYAQSKNEFTGEWSGDNGDSRGTVDAERTDMNAYLRLGSRDSINFRLGYRYFKYEFSDGLITSPGEIDRNGIAKGDMTTGLDGELNLVFGDQFQFGLGIGGTYFMDADYTWEYDKEVGGNTSHQTGSATVNGYSARVRPEISFKVNDSLRIFLNYTLQATMWEGTPDNAKDYPGVDVYSAAAGGVRVML